jgi:hypothetical protein
MFVFLLLPICSAMKASASGPPGCYQIGFLSVNSDARREVFSTRRLAHSDGSGLAARPLGDKLLSGRYKGRDTYSAWLPRRPSRTASRPSNSSDTQRASTFRSRAYKKSPAFTQERTLVVSKKCKSLSKKSRTKSSLSFVTSQQGTNGQWMLQKRGTQVHEKRL